MIPAARGSLAPSALPLALRSPMLHHFAVCLYRSNQVLALTHVDFLLLSERLAWPRCSWELRRTYSAFVVIPAYGSKVPALKIQIRSRGWAAAVTLAEAVARYGKFKWNQAFVGKPYLLTFGGQRGERLMQEPRSRKGI
jgi:hypothetical protein